MQNQRKKLLLVIGVLLAIFLIIGGSYAIWRLTVTQTGINRISSSCFNLSLTKEENVIQLENAFPVYDEEGKTFTPYSFTIENTCDVFASYTVQLEMSKSSTLPTKYLRAMVNNEAILNLNEYEESTDYIEKDTQEARILAKGSLGSGDSEDYTLRLWIDSDVDQNTTEAIGKSLSARVTVKASPSTYSPVENGITTLHDAILANEYQTTDVQVAIDKINAKQQPDFTKTAPIIEWQETSSNDTTGISYTMPDPADVGSGKEYAANLTSSNVYVGLGTSYRFDSETGKYYLENMIYRDPSTIDFSTGNYYICTAGTIVNPSGILSVYNNTNCTTMHKVVSLESKTSTTNYTYPAIKYIFQIVKHKQTELESDKSDKGLYTAQDSYGLSYYYRGSVKNNYVQFAGYYWRIIRINGDGSIRMLYSGTAKDASGTAAQIGKSAFNTARNLPLYVGYMYGNIDGSSLQEVNDNITNSTIKTYLESWYNTNLSSYSEFIADTGFCNDRTLSMRSGNGNGVQTNKITYYAAYERYNTNYSPTLNCPDKTNDLFTVTNEIGNQALTAPVGLVTMDELMLAGVRANFINTLTYAYSKESYWTMTPSHYSSNGTSAAEFLLLNEGIGEDYQVTNNLGVRPVINLAANVEITGGIGTQNEPFVVKTT